MAVKGWREYGAARTARSDEGGGGRGRGVAVVMPVVSPSWKWKWRGTPPHRPGRARFIPGKTRENRHLLRYLLSLGVPSIERIYTGEYIHRVYLYTRPIPSPPPSPLRRPSNRALIL